MVKEVAFFKGNRMSFYDVGGYYEKSRLYMSRNELKLAISLRRRDSYNQTQPVPGISARIRRRSKLFFHVKIYSNPS